jgi:hypothetical protein
MTCNNEYFFSQDYHPSTLNVQYHQEDFGNGGLIFPENLFGVEVRFSEAGVFWHLEV